MMQFKRAVALTFPSLPSITGESLERLAFKPCGKQELASSGFVSPRGFDSLVGQSPDKSLTIVCLQTEEKLLPPTVIKRALEDRVAQIKRSEDRTPNRKERQELKEEITFEFLPRAFTTLRRTNAIIDHTNHLILVDGGQKAGEAVTVAMREALGSLPALPIATKLAPQRVMTDWLQNGMPDQITVGDYCKLEELADGGAVQTCKNDDPQSPLIGNALEAGRQVVELGLEVDPIAFILTGSLALRAIRFSDMAVESALEGIEDFEAEAQAALLLNATALAGAFNAITAALGGLEQAELPLTTPTLASAGNSTERAPEAEPSIADIDPLLADARDLVTKANRASVSFLQRSLRIGYNRSAHLIELLEAEGTVSQMAANGARTVLLEPTE
ncbi:recombination-associated protein RdgC [Spongiibacter sp. UBA1325]|uniref:recombination-associated protein RdgC n=1 Tax=Spongiibacter sp. UBA1325 TaxID=1947543 RepID=UPI002580BA33|nr:recombination-associated protein RdgC [Spongiibacter sp. UBA1325]|tara:strand:- start:22958 stop:24121 length:1164 start_codon:yes stop_codon:yes gene_type:complete